MRMRSEPLKMPNAQAEKERLQRIAREMLHLYAQCKLKRYTHSTPT